MTLSDRDIKAALELGELVITPLAEGAIQPTSVDLTLSRWFRKFVGKDPIDTSKPLNMADWPEFEVPEGEPLWAEPWQFYLGSTVERLTIDANTSATVTGKSSPGRLAVIVHYTAGHTEAGFDGTITLEMMNQLPVPQTIWPGKSYAQVVLTRTISPAEHPYAGKYQNQDGPKVSEYWRNFKEAK